MPCGLRFSADDLRPVRRVTARRAARAGLPAGRADDVVIAVSEIAANAVRYASPAARLLLRVADGGRRRPRSAIAAAGSQLRERPPMAGTAAGWASRWRAWSAMRSGSGPGGTAGMLRMSLLARRGEPR